MNLAAGIALASATLHAAVAALLSAISRAPGWRVARTFAAIALSAALYSSAELLMCVGGLPEWVYLAAGRFNYAAASLHAAAWLVYAFGGPEAEVSAMPRWVRGLAAVVGGVGVTGALLPGFVGPSSPVDIAWAGVRYHYPATSALSDAVGYVLMASLVLAGTKVALRVVNGERQLRWVLPGMLVFLLCALDEVLVANRVVVFLSLADLGFVALVFPLSVQVVGRYGADARRLEALTHRLEDEVRERTERLDRAKQALIRSERLAALGRIAAGVSHEINNPLAWMRVALEDLRAYLEATAAPADLREALGEAREGLDRIQGVAERLRSQARSEGGAQGSVEVGEIVQQAVELAMADEAPVPGVELDLATVPYLTGDAPRLAQALANLVVNAAAAAAERGGERRIFIRTRKLPGGEVCLEVEDEGVGIPPEVLPRLGEPYYTTRANRGALGLGLFVARGIAEAHGGRLEIDSRSGEGTRARLVLPSASRTALTFMT